MRTTLKWVLITAIGLVPIDANAATYRFNFSTNDSLFTVTAAITTADTLDAVGGYDVLSISGTISGPGGGAITLEPNPTQPFSNYRVIFSYDNVYFPDESLQVDTAGILFSAGNYDYNLYSNGATYYLSSNNPVGVYDPGEGVALGGPFRIDSVTSAPEPSTWAMMLVGFAGLGVMGWRGWRRTAAHVA
jgi:hypothetical protein